MNTRFLTVDSALSIHQELIEQFGGINRIRDINLFSTLVFFHFRSFEYYQELVFFALNLG
jgi:hypothetical protein